MAEVFKALKRINEYVWEIPKSYRADMRVPARLYIGEKLLKETLKDRSVEQLVNTATLPGIEKYALAMPDIHEGYGFPIGGVVATRAKDGVISPGGVGYDINCGVRLLRSPARIENVLPNLEELAVSIQHNVPSGLGVGGYLKAKGSDMDGILERGVDWMIDREYGIDDDRIFCEAAGHLPQADPGGVSQEAKQRGLNQLGTIGSGNHFVEVQRVDEIFDEKTAAVLHLFRGQVVVLVHTGSRGLGHQTATDYIRLMMKVMPYFKIELPDRELACAPFNSPEGIRYYEAMNAAANFAFANRQFITHQLRKSWREIFGETFGTLQVVYDVAHNMVKVEAHRIGSETRELVVHRKGATRAFGPGRPEIPALYRDIGQPVFIPGSMGTASYVLIGQERAMEETFGTSCHGAGRIMSRHEAMRRVPYETLQRSMREQGILVRAGSVRGLVEEAPVAYKDVEEVVRVVHDAGIAKRVARLKPVAVIKG